MPRLSESNFLAPDVTTLPADLGPSDLAGRLREIVSKPGDAEIKTLTEPKEEDGLIVRLTECDSLADITAMLPLAEQGNFKVSEKTGMPSAAGSLKILECLTGGDFYPPEVAFAPKTWSHEQEIGFIKPVAWALLLILLMEYAATLGLIDIAFVHPACARDDFREQWGADDMKWLSRHDGLRAFRLTNLGAYCLGYGYKEAGRDVSRPACGFVNTG